MSAFNLEERRILDSMFGSGSPANYEVGLSTTAPNEDGTGITEPSGVDGYARVTVTNDVTNWPAATTLSDVTTQKNGLSITSPIATGSWGTVTHWVIWDQASGDEVIFGTLPVPSAIGVGDRLRIPLGEMILTLE